MADSRRRGYDVLDGKCVSLSDTEEFLEILSTVIDYESEHDQNLGTYTGNFLFVSEEDIFVTRAPGRLDVMGGIADYSGSLVLQIPIKEACHAALQCRPYTKSEPRLKIVSLSSDSKRSPFFEMPMRDFLNPETKEPISYDEAKAYFLQRKEKHWAAYIAGVVLVLMKEKGQNFGEVDVSIFLSSKVPEGKGVSSSAAVEVASMAAFTAAFGIALEPEQMATLCQMVENRVVGAPCGIMDQMASALGKANQLLALVCRPAKVQGYVSVPQDLSFWGMDSGIRHSVGGSDYSSVRAGAFIGRRIIQVAANDWLSEVQGTGEFEEGQLTEECQLAHLCELNPHRFDRLYSKILPDSVLGSEFLESFGSHGDSLTEILPEKNYFVREPTRHPVFENFRVETFSELLGRNPSKSDGTYGSTSSGTLKVLGELMLQSHYSYSKCGLGSDGTDKIVNLVLQSGRNSKLENVIETLFGAKITGGGSGGTVCIIGRSGESSEDAIRKIKSQYEEESGRAAYLFTGSSPGAYEFGYLRLQVRRN